MRPNQNGFVIEGTYAIIFLISAATLAVFTLTPAKNLIHMAGEGQKSTQKQSYTETMEPYTVDGRPASVTLPDGSEGLLFKRTKTSSTLDETIQPKLSVWQRLMKVGWWWIALTIGGMFFGPLGMVMNAINSKAKQAALALAGQLKKKHEDLKSEAKRIVLSVDAGLDVFDSAISSAKAALDAATLAAAATSDPQLLAANHALMNTHQAVLKSSTDLNAAFLAQLKAKQDESTKLLIPQLRNSTPII